MWFTLIPAFLAVRPVVYVRMHHDGSGIARRPGRLLRTQVLAGWVPVAPGTDPAAFSAKQNRFVLSDFRPSEAPANG